MLTCFANSNIITSIGIKRVSTKIKGGVTSPPRPDTAAGENAHWSTQLNALEDIRAVFEGTPTHERVLSRAAVLSFR